MIVYYKTTTTWKYGQDYSIYEHSSIAGCLQTNVILVIDRDQVDTYAGLIERMRNDHREDVSGH